MPNPDDLFEKAHDKFPKALQPGVDRDVHDDDDREYLRCDVDADDQAHADAMWENVEWTGDGEPQNVSAQ